MEEKEEKDITEQAPPKQKTGSNDVPTAQVVGPDPSTPQKETNADITSRIKNLDDSALADFYIDTDILDPLVKEGYDIANRVHTMPEFYHNSMLTFPSFTQEYVRKLYDVDQQQEAAKQLEADIREYLEWYPEAINNVQRIDELLAEDARNRRNPEEDQNALDNRNVNGGGGNISGGNGGAGYSPYSGSPYQSLNPSPYTYTPYTYTPYTYTPYTYSTDWDNIYQRQSYTYDDNYDYSRLKNTYTYENPFDYDYNRNINTNDNNRRNYDTSVARQSLTDPNSYLKNRDWNTNSNSYDPYSSSRTPYSLANLNPATLTPYSNSNLPNSSTFSALDNSLNGINGDGTDANGGGKSGDLNGLDGKSSLLSVLESGSKKIASGLLSGKGSNTNALTGKFGFNGDNVFGQKSYATTSVAGAGLAMGIAGLAGGLYLNAKNKYYIFTPEDWEETDEEVKNAIIWCFKEAGMTDEEMDDFVTHSYRIKTSELDEHIKKLEKVINNDEQIATDFVNTYHFSIFDEDNHVDPYLLFVIMVIDGKYINDEVNFYNILNPYLDDENDIDFLYSGIDSNEYLYEEEDALQEITNDLVTE